MRRWLFSAAALVSAGLSTSAWAQQFASSVTEYAEGTFATVAGAHYTNTAAALGKPSPIVGAGGAFAGVLSPFNSHYEQDQLLGFGLTGGVTLRFDSPVSVTGTPQIGIFTNAALVDFDWPNGAAGSAPETGAMNEYGAERTAIVEVATDSGPFVSLGRIVFDDPVNYFANATEPYQFPAPSPAVEAAFDQPYAGGPSDFAGADFGGVLSQLNGSAGGTWLAVPTNLGLAEIQRVRLSDPMWRMPDGSLVSERPSVFFPPPDEFIKPADIFLDGVVMIPEPGALSLIVIGVALLARRRR